jgi:AraC-like DNA-binding protein
MNAACALTLVVAVADVAIVLSEGDIAASNVRPALEASLEHGATAAEIEAATGWTRAALDADEASVSAASTYRHMELMHRRPGYADFVLAATRRHTMASLGVVGLACKTSATVGEAVACHARYQHLTNRSARYHHEADGEHLIFREERADDSLGSQLISDYTMLIALQLLRASAADPVAVIALRSRRAEIPVEQRDAFEAFATAPIELGSPHAQLVLDLALLSSPVASADAELAGFFHSLLERAAPFADEPSLLRDARVAIRDRLPRGTPTAATIARALGLGQRTLQRRLAEAGVGFGDLLDETRRTLADGYLANHDLSLSEIAYLLGYGEQSSFFRAFRRWHGTTPAAYRQR